MKLLDRIYKIDRIRDHLVNFVNPEIL